MSVDNIWFTSKARMHAEAKFHLYDRWSHVVLTWYSLFTIIFSIFSDKLALQLPNVTNWTLAFSIIVFGMSLVVSGFSFGTRANQHRDCYLRLQKLNSEATDNKDKIASYHKILEHFPNHSSSDFDAVVVERVFFKKEALSIADKPRIATKWMIANYIFNWILFRLSCIAAISLPAAILVIALF